MCIPLPGLGYTAVRVYNIVHLRIMRCTIIRFVRPIDNLYNIIRDRRSDRTTRTVAKAAAAAVADLV